MRPGNLCMECTMIFCWISRGNESKVQILTQEHVESTGQEAWQ